MGFEGVARGRCRNKRAHDKLKERLNMSETRAIVFKHSEVLEALLKKQGIYEGIWALRITFGLKATNIGPSEDSLSPAAIVGIIDIGIQKAEKESSIAVDAAKVNPKPKGKVTRRK